MQIAKRMKRSISIEVKKKIHSRPVSLEPVIIWGLVLALAKYDVLLFPVVVTKPEEVLLQKFAYLTAKSVQIE